MGLVGYIVLFTLGAGLLYLFGPFGIGIPILAAVLWPFFSAFWHAYRSS